MPDCPTCGADVAEGETRCPDCNTLLATPPDSQPTPSRLTDLAVGFVAGLLALVVGFGATVGLSDVRENRDLAEQLLGSNGPVGVAVSELLPEWYHLITWAFLENHRVDVTVTAGETFGDAGWVGAYVETLLPAATDLQFLFPLLLSGAGVLVAVRRPRDGPADALVAGWTVVAGYLPGIAVVAAVATFEVAVLGDVVILEIGPDFGRAVLVAGVAYPLLFGGLGGLVAFVARSALRDR